MRPSLEQIIALIITGYLLGGLAMAFCEAWFFLPISVFGLVMLCRDIKNAFASRDETNHTKD